MDAYQQLSPDTRVWIYQSNRPLNRQETKSIDKDLQAFAIQWVSHNQQLQAYGRTYHQHFLVLMVDESRAGASGCSIDKSVHFLQQLEKGYQIQLFDRLTVAYQQNGEVHLAPKKTFIEHYQTGKITGDTLVFDNLIQTKAALETTWLKPLSQSWHKRYIQ